MMMTGEQAIARAKQIDPTATKFVVRLWDGFDGEWMDVTKPLSAEAAMADWMERTDNGERKTGYDDIDYYAIYPTTTKMRFSEGNSMTRSSE